MDPHEFRSPYLLDCRRTDLLRACSALPFVIALGACGPNAAPKSRSAPSPESSAAPKAVCVHLVKLLRPIAETRPDGQLRLAKFQTDCEDDERDEREDDERHWECRSSCILAASTVEHAKDCEKTCERPSALTNCSAALSASELSATLGIPTTKVDDADDEREHSCVRHFEVHDHGILQMSLVEHRTKAAAKQSLAPSANDEAYDEAPIVGLGDAAERWRAPFEATPGCHVGFAKHRVSARIMLPQATCQWDALIEVAKKVAARLP